VLDDLVYRWRSAGKPPEPSIAWPRARWLAAFPQYGDLLRSLPSQLDRTAHRAVCAEAVVDAKSAERALVAVMAWGQGNNGYAQIRTSDVVSTPRAADRLLSVARTLAAEGAVAACRRLGDDHDCRLYRLGPAFGTKYLYFCQPVGQEITALIHDRLVSDWLLEHAALALISEGWSERRSAYSRQMRAWAADLGCAADDVELCTFREMATDRDSQWSTP